MVKRNEESFEVNDLEKVKCRISDKVFRNLTGNFFRERSEIAL